MSPQPSFDPYHQWLGIPPAEQPPHHYRLLGLSTFESDPNVIEQAADRQMAHVRTFQAGPRSAQSQKLLNELSAARLALLKPATKRQYDDALRAKLRPPGPPSVVSPLPTPQPTPVASPQSLVAPVPLPPAPGPIAMSRIARPHDSTPHARPVASLPAADIPAADARYQRSPLRPRRAAPLVASLVSAGVIILGVFLFKGGTQNRLEFASKPAATQADSRPLEPATTSHHGRPENEQTSGADGQPEPKPRTTQPSNSVESIDADDLPTSDDDPSNEEPNDEGPVDENARDHERHDVEPNAENVAEDEMPDETGIDDSTAATDSEPEPITEPIVERAPKKKTSALAQQLIDRLDDPSDSVRQKAVNDLSRVGSDDAEPACLAMVAALDDISPRVREAALRGIRNFGPLAQPAVPTLIARYREAGDKRAKAELIEILGFVNGDAEKGIRLLIEVTRGASAGKARMFSKEFSPEERLAAVTSLGRVGPPAEKAVPTILGVLKLSALDLKKYKAVFVASADALGKVGIVDRGVETTLKKIRDGKGVKPPNMVEEARVVADSALRRLEQSGRKSGQPEHEDMEDDDATDAIP